LCNIDEEKLEPLMPLKTPLSPYPTRGPRPKSRAKSGCSLGSEKDPSGEVPTESRDEGLGDDMTGHYVVRR